MRNKANTIILAATVAAFAALLLQECCGKNREHSSQKETEFHIPAPIDTSKMDEEFYKRMREFEALHPDVPLDR